ncbi:MAG: NAD(P)-dependent alcohol dehydrogenase [Halobacteriota archaeon]
MDIHAFAALGPGAALHPFDYELRELRPYEIDIEVSHCGVCHSDIHLIDNDWNISHYPLVPGHEIVGAVRATGVKVKRLSVGKRVGVGWQSGSCLRCEWCLNGYENLCRNKVLTCVKRYGGFADFVRTDSRFAFTIPDSLDSASAAPLLCAGLTVYAPMKRIGLRPHDHVGIVGIGGLGHIALQFARAMDCEVTAFSTNPKKEEDSFAFGADHFVNSRNENEMQGTKRTLDFILLTASAPSRGHPIWRPCGLTAT